jgi:hypothetical protein
MEPEKTQSADPLIPPSSLRPAQGPEPLGSEQIPSDSSETRRARPPIRSERVEMFIPFQSRHRLDELSRALTICRLRVLHQHLYGVRDGPSVEDEEVRSATGQEYNQVEEDGVCYGPQGLYTELSSAYANGITSNRVDSPR